MLGKVPSNGKQFENPPWTWPKEGTVCFWYGSLCIYSDPMFQRIYYHDNKDHLLAKNPPLKYLLAMTSFSELMI